MTTVLPTLQASLRSLRRTPGFVATSLLILALGIGLSTAVFTVADALLLRRLPIKDQNRVILLWGHIPNRGFDHFPFGLGEASEFARLSTSLQASALVAYEGAAPTTVQDGAEVSRLRRALVSGDYFAVLEVEPLLGRALRPTDDATGAAPVAVLSSHFWRHRFGGDPHVLGRRLLNVENGVTYTIVGVMPPGLEYPKGTDLWAPIRTSISTTNLDFAAFDIIGRLSPGATASMARQELSTFLGRPDASPWERDMRAVVSGLTDIVLGEVRPALLAFGVAAALLLLITCANVANLLLVRGLDRTREIAVRSALGADRARVTAQLLTENALLAVAGGLLGMIVAALGVRFFLAFSPAGLPRLDQVHLNSGALAGAIVITGLAMVLFGLAPALMTSRIDLQQALRLGTRHSSNRPSRRAVEMLVAGQMSLAVIVLAAAGLIARSLLKLESVELSLVPTDLLIGQLAIRSDQYGTPAKQVALVNEVTARLQALPGIQAVSPVVAVPFSGSGGWDGRPAAEGQSLAAASTNRMLNMEVVTPDYFRTLGIPVLRGRNFTAEDRENAPGVVILSESAARDYWPNQDPIGKRLKFGADLERTLTVVGLVPETRYRDLREARATVYFPLSQSSFPFAPTTLAIRTHGTSAAVVTGVRSAIGEVAPGVTLASIAPFNDLLEAPLAQPRLTTALLALFAGAAVLLAALGLYTVMATMVRQRRRELAIRQALGATPLALNQLVLCRGLAIASVGAVVGLVGVLLANRLLRALLFEVSPNDLPTLGATAAGLLGVAILASLLPARTASQVAPAVVLRSDG